jgi:HTH DNA binding domain
MAEGDRAVTEALALARLLRHLPATAGRDKFDATEAAKTLASLGGGGLNVEKIAAWWLAHVPKPDVRRRRYGMKGAEGGDLPLPPPLNAARAAQSWMEAGIAKHPAPAYALFATAGLLARVGVTHAVFLPVWAAYPAAGFGDRDHLPTLRSDAADRLLGRDRPVTWPLAFLHLVAESARAGLRELDRLEAATAKGRGLAAAVDKRSRLPDALEALLRTPVLTPKALAGQLGIAPQTGTALLRALQAKGVVREVTGRGSFRAFAV